MSNKELFGKLLEDIRAKAKNPYTMDVVQFYIDNPDENPKSKKELIERLNISKMDYLQTEKEILEILKKIADEIVEEL